MLKNLEKLKSVWREATLTPLLFLILLLFIFFIVVDAAL